MVQNMGVGNVQGYCVGEPWGAVAVRQGIGFTHLATQDLWLNHPEKAFLVTRKFKEERPDVVKDCMAAILKASKWLDDFDNRAQAAEVIGAEQYINAPAAEIAGRLGGVYDLGADLGEKDFKGDQMRFFRDGATNFPRQVPLHLGDGAVPALRLPHGGPALPGAGRRAHPHRPLRRGRRGRGHRHPRRRHGSPSTSCSTTSPSIPSNPAEEVNRA